MSNLDQLAAFLDTLTDTAHADGAQSRQVEVDGLTDRLAAANRTVTDLTGQAAAATARAITAESARDAAVNALADYQASHPDAPATPEPASVRRMLYGVSATPGNFETGYNNQVRTLGAEVGYLYGQDPRGVDFDEIPDAHPLWLQTKGTSRAQFDAELASFPKTRKGVVRFHPPNEPEGKIVKGTYTLPQWQRWRDDLYAAIEAAGLPYVVPAVEIQYMTLQQTVKGTTDPTRRMESYISPGVKAVAFSAYAEKRLRDGHEEATTDPVKMPATIKAWADKTGLPWSVVTGWAVANNLLSDPITLERRAAWLKAVAPELAKAGCEALMWFDTTWTVDGVSSDYRLANDPGLLAVWQGLRNS